MRSFVAITLFLIGGVASAAEGPAPVGAEAIEIANMVKNPAVAACMTVSEQKYGASLNISEITRQVVDDKYSYTITGYLLQEGDIALGELTLSVQGNLSFPYGFSYECTVVSGPPIPKP